MERPSRNKDRLVSGNTTIKSVALWDGLTKEGNMGDIKKLVVCISSPEMTAEELEWIRNHLECSEGWQITGDEDRDFYMVVSIDRKV